MRIVSDGTPRGTKVYDDSGNTIRMIQKVYWSISVDGIATATITVLDVEIDANATDINIVKKSIE